MRTSAAVRLAVGAGIVAATWHAASVRLASGVLDLIPFTAPGMLIGLLIGWLSFALMRGEFRWRTGLISAIVGAVVLPPWLGVLVAISGITTAGAVFLLVAGAWAAVAIGGVIALFRGADQFLRRWRARRVKLERRRRSHMPRWRMAIRRGGFDER
jgi:hypothetical protein